MRKHTGWGKGKRPFSETEWRNSHIKKSFGGTYNQYLTQYYRIKHKEAKGKVRKTTRRAAPKRSADPFAATIGW